MPDGKHPSEQYHFAIAEPLSAEEVQEAHSAIQEIIGQFCRRFATRRRNVVDATALQGSEAAAFAKSLETGFADAFVNYVATGVEAGEFPAAVTRAVAHRARKQDEPDETSPPIPGYAGLDAEPYFELVSRQLSLTAEDQSELDRVLPQLMALVDRIAASHEKLIRGMVAMFNGRGVDLNELRQEAYLGLRKAILSYDPGRGSLKAIGRQAIWSHLTDVTNAAYNGKSRTGRELKEYYCAQARVGHNRGRTATHAEICDELKIRSAKCRDQLAQVVAAAKEQTLPVTPGEEDEIAVPHDDPSPVELADDCDREQRIHEAVHRLPGELREVIMLRYFEGVATLDEVASRLNLTLDQVRGRHKKAKDLLSQDLASFSGEARGTQKA